MFIFYIVFFKAIQRVHDASFFQVNIFRPLKYLNIFMYYRMLDLYQEPDVFHLFKPLLPFFLPSKSCERSWGRFYFDLTPTTHCCVFCWCWVTRSAHTVTHPHLLFSHRLLYWSFCLLVLWVSQLKNRTSNSPGQPIKLLCFLSGKLASVPS